MLIMLLLIGYLLFVHLILLIPGYAFVKRTGFFENMPGLKLCAAYLVSILTLALLAIGGYVFDIPRYWLHSLPWVLIAFGVYYFWKHRLWRELVTHRFVLLAFVAMTIFTCSFMSLQLTGHKPYFPDPQFHPEYNYQTLNVKVLNIAQTPANDNYVPYRQAQFMINRSDPAKDSFIDEWGVHFFQRTPLLGAVSAQFFTLLGDTPPVFYSWAPEAQDPDNTYPKFQIIGHIMNALFILPAYFLLARLFDRRSAAVTVLFMVPSAFFLFNSFFTWPKSLVAFFILFSWLLLFEKQARYLVVAGVASGIAYLAHDLAVLYIGASALLLLYWRRFRHLLLFVGLNVLFFIPWFIASAIVYHKPSSFMLYPFSLHDIPQISQKREIIREFFHTSPLHILWIKIHNFFYLVSPYQLLTSEGGQGIGRRLWALTLFNVSGAAGLGLIIPSILGAIKKIRAVEFWILALVPIILCTLVIGWPKGMGALHFAQASVVLFMGLGVWFLAKLKNPWWLVGAFVVNAAQLIFFGLYSYYFRAGVWLTSLPDLLLLVTLAGILVLCGIGVYLLAVRRTGNWRLAIRWAKARLPQSLR